MTSVTCMHLLCTHNTMYYTLHTTHYSTVTVHMCTSTVLYNYIYTTDTICYTYILYSYTTVYQYGRMCVRMCSSLNIYCLTWQLCCKLLIIVISNFDTLFESLFLNLLLSFSGIFICGRLIFYDIFDPLATLLYCYVVQESIHGRLNITLPDDYTTVL